MKKSEASSYSSTEFINTLNKYIPSLVLQQWINKIDANQLNLPEIQDLETVVLFADISGFTMISEACALMGVRGNEELAFCINRYMEGMVKALGKYGGDIIKFVGDAMIVMWPRISQTGQQQNHNASIQGKNGTLGTQSQQKEYQDDIVTIVRKAVQCALDIQNELNNKKIMSNVTNLSVKIGIGFGECALLYVGGVFNRAEFFTVGDALTQALKSEECCTGGGQIIVSQNAFKHVEQYFKGEEIEEHGKKFYKVSEMIIGIRTRADAVLLRNLFQPDNFARITNKLKACVPAAIMPYLEIGYEQYGSETRRLSVMFASLGVDLSSAQTVEGMKKIQRIVTIVQQQVYRMEGSLNKLVMDDKGSTLICIWGLSPFAHEDDSARAILTAINMRRELKEVENTWCNVGISTGEVFSGVVGTSGSRKEFSVLGDFVNLAARIMFWPKKKNQTGKIYVDLQTKRDADNFIKFIYQGHCEFKGKSISLPIFEPVDPADEIQEANKKILSIDTLLKIHSNPFLVDRNSENKKKQCKQIGRQDVLRRICDDMTYFFDSDEKIEQTFMVAVLGEPGSGKTLFARSVVDRLKRQGDLVIDDSKIGQNTESATVVVTSALNSESQMQFLNSWRPILQMISFIHCKKFKLTQLQLINKITKMIPSDKLDLVLDILHLNVPERKKNQKDNDPLSFVKREKYSDDIVEVVIDFFVEFIKEVVGDKDDSFLQQHSQQQESISSEEQREEQIGEEDDSHDSDRHEYQDDDEEEESSREDHNEDDDQDEDEEENQEEDDDEDSFIKKTSQKKNKNQNQPQQLNLIMIIDTVYLMDEASWKLLDLLKDECQRLAIILLVQTDTNNLPKIHSEARGFYQETFGNNIESQIKIIDLAPFQLEELSQLLVQLSPQYQDSMGEEIELMTSIEDPAHTIKNPDVCTLKEIEFATKYHVDETFEMVSEDVLKVAIERCEGNPLVCLNFIFNLLTNDYLQVKGEVLMGNSNFMKCVQRQDWSSVPVPSLTSKINNTLLDSYLKEMRTKSSKESENGVKGLLILKSASVIGDMFGSSALQHIAPMRNETHKSIAQILKILEQKDFIEILDETDQKNIICRFRKCFLRETIYQAMLYRDQKKGLHQLMAQYIQGNPFSMDQDPEIESEKLLNHILISEDLDSEEKVPFKSKQGLIVKKLSTLLIKSPHAIMKSGWLTKQGSKPNKNIEKRLIILRAKAIYWFHDNAEFKKNIALGVIPLDNIYHCVPANRFKNTSDLLIGTCAWTQKGIDKEGKRDFIFGARSEEERDEWISSIEYLRAKYIYDNFVHKYGNIQFPLRKASNGQKVDEREDMKSMIDEFGTKFKYQTRVSVILSPETSPKKVGGKNSKRPSQSRVLGKLGSFATYNIHDSKDNPLHQNILNNPNEIAKKLKKLYNANIITFLSQVTSNANKSNNIRQDQIKRLPNCLKNSSMFVVSNEELVLGDLSGTIIKGSSIQSMISNDDRRISQISRKDVMEDNGEINTYLEDLKAGGSSARTETKKASEDGSKSRSRKSVVISEKSSSLQGPGSHILEEHKYHSASSVDTAAFQEKQEQKHHKSRISKQLDQFTTRERELTFNHNESNPQAFQITPVLGEKSKLLQKIEQIEEEEEQKEQENNFTSEKRHLNDESAQNRMTADFSDNINESEKVSFKSHQSKPVSIQEQQFKKKLSQSERKKSEQIINTSHASHASNKEVIVAMPKAQEIKVQEVKVEEIKVEEVKESLQDITAAISKTIQEQLSKNFIAFFQNAQQIGTNMLKTNKGGDNDHIVHNQSMDDSKSEVSNRSYISQRSHGGASSSKKVQIEQVQSKSSKSYKKEGKHQDEDDDDIQDPDTDKTNSRHQKSQKLKTKHDQFPDKKVTPPKVKKQRSSQETSEKQFQQPFDYQQAMQQHFALNGYFPSPITPINIYPHQQQFSSPSPYSLNVYSPINPLQNSFNQYHPPMYGGGMLPQPQMNPYYYDPYQMGNGGSTGGPNISHFQTPFGTNNNYSNQIQPNTQGLNYQQEPGDYLPFDDMENEFEPIDGGQGGLYPYISEISSIQGVDSEQNQPQYAIVLEDCQCSMKGELFTIYEGDKVEVVRIIAELDLVQCRFNNDIGLFPLPALKLIKRSNRQSPPKPQKTLNKANYQEFQQTSRQMEQVQAIQAQLQSAQTQKRSNFFNISQEKNNQQLTQLKQQELQQQKFLENLNNQRLVQQHLEQLEKEDPIKSSLKVNDRKKKRSTKTYQEKW